MPVTLQILIKSGSSAITMQTEGNTVGPETLCFHLANSARIFVWLVTAITKLKVHFQMIIEICNLNQHIERSEYQEQHIWFNDI